MILSMVDDDLYLDTDELIGRRVEEAVRLLEDARQLEYRIQDDDEPSFGTTDHKFFRMNVKVNKGIVYDIRWG